MFEWNVFYAIDGSFQNKANLLDKKVINFREIDYIKFELKIPTKNKHWGSPNIIVNDIPIPITELSKNNNNYIYESTLTGYKSRIFFNYFGESLIYLSFDDNPDYEKYVKVNILARKENAKIAKEMLTFLDKRYKDIVRLCFSRSNIRAGYSHYKEPDISIKIRKINKIINFLTQYKRDFELNRKISWKDKLEFHTNGILSGDKSIHWLLQHTDLLSPSEKKNANFVWNNIMYNINPVPTQVIKENTDLYENRVLHSFILSAKIFLINAKDYYNNLQLDKGKVSTDSNHGFVHFDHVIKEFKSKIFDYYISKINHCLLKLEYILKWMNKIIPAKSIPNIMPRMTAFSHAHLHYQKSFQFISEWYNLGKPNYEIKDHLSGLRNLSTIYEFFCLLTIIESLQKNMGYKLTDSKYHKHSINFSFGGKEKKLPSDTLNNVYFLKKKDISIELFYEPRIYKFSSNLREGDLFNISSTSDRYSNHYYSPDFLLKIKSIELDSPITIILDAKYTHSNNVKNIKINELVKKYLLGIRMVDHNVLIQNTPIQMVYALFAHDDNYKSVSYYAKKHQLTGRYAILPAIGGILVTPKATKRLDDLLINFFNHIFPQQKSLEYKDL